MEDAWIVGVAATPFRRWVDRSYGDLVREAVADVFADAANPDRAPLAGVWFGSCALHAWGQPNVRGQVVLEPLVASGALPARVPIVNVEAGCATGILALHGAMREVQAGADLALAIGVDKTYLADPSRIGALFEGAIDKLDPEGTRAFYASAADAAGQRFAPEAARSVLLDIGALEAREHQRRYGTTREELATIASKNRAHGAMNPRAQVRAPMTPEQVLADKLVLDPFTRAMCSPISDGAAAVLVASSAWVAKHGRSRALRLAGVGLAGGMRRPLGEPNETPTAAARAWKASGFDPASIQVAEVHDATAFAELAATEALGFSAPGEGGRYATSGATRLGGARPVNPSGGLESRGHPLAASGLAMVHEIATQLRGEAEERQVEGARVGLVHNAGGLIGFDEALAGVAVIEAPTRLGAGA